MSWDFTADDLRKEIKELREKLAVQGVKVGEQETRLLKNEEELGAAKENYADTLNKLRKEADRALELEESLKRRTLELRNERNLRENVEQALRTAKEEREKEAATAREAQHYLSRTATESNEHHMQREKLAAEKAKLDAQIRELQGELHRCQNSPPPPLKTPARPRASSLTNLNKVAILERDIEQIRASASASEMDLKSTQEKLSRMQSDFLRLENEKAALEKKLKDQASKVKEVLADKSELQAEVDFYREQNASHSREEELVTRLEEEEAKVALLEQQLAKTSSSGAMKRSIDQLQTQLNREISRREAVEAREVRLVQEREEALSEVGDIRSTLHDLETAIARKETRINELEAQSRTLQEQLETSTYHAVSASPAIDEEKITDLVNGIARIRAERDELKAHLAFVQMEAHFKIEALEKKLAEQVISAAGEAELQQIYETLVARIRNELNEERCASRKLRTAASAMLVAIQHLDSQSECLSRRRAAPSSPVLSTSYGTANLTSVHTNLGEQPIVEALHENLRAKAEEASRLIHEHQLALSSKDEELSELKLRLSDISVALREEKEVRSSLEEQVRQLEVDLHTAKQELTDALEHNMHLEARQAINTSSDSVVRSLRSEIEELRGRVTRRTEQIGLQQHDIKRLETNMRLTDERLEEVLGELEMAETAKAAMLEDCSVAREERDQVKRALVQAELEVEQLSVRVQEMEEEIDGLRSALASVEERERKALLSKDGELIASSAAVAERDTHIKALIERLEGSESALRTSREQADILKKQLASIQETSAQSIEELQKCMQSDKDAASRALEHGALELQSLSKDVEASKVAVNFAERALEAKNEEYKHAMHEIEVLKASLEQKASETNPSLLQSNDQAGANMTDRQCLLAALDAERLAHQETREKLLVKEEEFKQKSEDLHQLIAELDVAKASEEEAVRVLQLKEMEFNANSAELKRLMSQLEMNETKERDSATILEAKESRLAEMEDRVSQLETEKAGLVAQLTAFDSESEKELTDSVSLRSTLEDERMHHEKDIKRLETELASLHAEKEVSDLSNKDLVVRYEETLALLEATKEELKEKETLCNTLAAELRNASNCREDEAADLKKQSASLVAEIQTLQLSLQDEMDGRRQEVAAHEKELRAALDKQESISVMESELRQSIEQYQQQLVDLRATVTMLQDKNSTLQSEMDNLAAECHRANLRSQSLEKQLSSNGKNLSDLQDKLSRLREALSKSEKSGKTAEMNLLLIGQQHERTISSLRSQLKEHEKDAERIQKLQQIVGETREQISEMESLLKAKTAEIEDNDDKFIQLLKEKKRLTSKVESLTKKNNNLQNKLSAALAESSNVVTSSEGSARRSTITEPVRPPSPLPTAVLGPSEIPAQPATRERESNSVSPSQSETPREMRRISGSKRRRESTPPLDEIPVTTSIGKKRPLPDDSDSGRAPVEARFPDTIKSNASGPATIPVASSSTSVASSALGFTEVTSTPRQRRHAPRSGFTPVRGHAATLRPTLSQPSPNRQSAAAQARQTTAAIADITNSPPRSKRVFAEPESDLPRVPKPAGKGWLGKIRGGTNPLSRARQQLNSGSS